MEREITEGNLERNIEVDPNLQGGPNPSLAFSYEEAIGGAIAPIVFGSLVLMGFGVYRGAKKIGEIIDDNYEVIRKLSAGILLPKEDKEEYR